MFMAGPLVVLGLLEVLVASQAALFAAASHRALAKAAVFDKRPRVDYVFLGTSRTQDGVSPVLATRALGEIAPFLGKMAGFNAAFTGASLEGLLALAPRFTARTGLQAVLIELSGPQLHNEPTPWAKPVSPETTFEAKLAKTMAHLQFVRYRSAFLPENLGRLPALLLFSSAMSGWETKGIDQLGAWLGRKEQSASGFDPVLWQPEVLTDTAAPARLDPALEEKANQLAALAQAFRAQGIAVVFTAPPLAQDISNASENKLFRPVFSEVARRSHCEVWNYAALPLPEFLFRDCSHLGREGRAHYSRALALRLARILNDR